jgi:4a-hydroxytetrahydrobiopterin dehydratase
MSKLAQKECVACNAGTPPLKGEALIKLTQELSTDWRVVKEHQLEREYKFSNFRDALAFTNKVGALAEAQNHHPDFYLAWGQVKLTLWTHSIEGLSEGDFIFAAKVDDLSAKG